MTVRLRLSRRFMTWLIRSPLSGPLNGSLMLITVRGRYTGTEHTFPVQYAEDDASIWVLPGHPERKTWWRNLLPEAPVALHVRGREVSAMGRAFLGDASPSVVEQGLTVYARRFPRVGRQSGIMQKSGAIDPERLREVARASVLVRVAPMAGESTRPG